MTKTKSDMVNEMADRLGIPVVDVPMSEADANDSRGLPIALHQEGEYTVSAENRDPVTVSADSPLQAALQSGFTQCIVDVHQDRTTWTYTVRNSDTAVMLHKVSVDRLVKATVYVRVPGDCDIEEFLNEADFSVTDQDGNDIYDRVEDYEAVE